MVKNEIKVFARLKPEANIKNVVNYQVHRRPKKYLEEDYLVLNGTQKSINEYINNRPESWNFAFHKIFDYDVKQDEVFENVAQPVVQSVLNGYNGTIFAYGQTGSGKTFSITGDPERYEDRGILPRTVQYLFETIQKNPDNLYSVEIAYLEIYNENGYDLLDPKHEVVTKLEDLPRVTIQEDETGKLHLKNLSFRSVENEKDALALLFLGDTNRAISETPMNPQSSRSHCIFTIAVSVKQSGAQHLSKAKMHLVDLAGSERVYKCCISGSILTEAKHINLSLHYLEQVIVSLGQQNVSHIPYRNSLLTAILRDSLGGNCLTTMLATLSLNTSNLEETISTSRFSQRVALIKNDVNLVLEKNPEDENRFLKMEIEKLKNEIAQLTKRPIISGELTAKEKDDLNFKVRKFLKSDETIEWENDERKMKYCLQVLRENLKNRNGEKYNAEEPDKDLNYYRNLVVQRDKEISALINMLKKAGRNSSNNSTDDPGSFETREYQDETSPRMSIIAKKVRLRDLMVEARSIAQLIKNGKASIGDLRKRMTNNNPIEIQAIHETLKIEQSRLARNLSLLKTLKSEATNLQTAIIEEGKYPENFDADSTRRSVNEKSSTPRIHDEEFRKNHLIASQTLPSIELRAKKDDCETSRSIQPPEALKIVSLAPKEVRTRMKVSEHVIEEEFNPNDPRKSRAKGDVGNCEIACIQSARKSNSIEVGSLISKIIEADVMRSPSRSRESKTGIFEDLNLRKPYSNGDSERNLVGERFNETKTLFSGESRRSSFRAPAFLQEMLQSDGDSAAVFESTPFEKHTDFTPRNIGFNEFLDGSISDANMPLAGVEKTKTTCAGSSSNCKLSSEKSDEYYEKYVKEVSKEPGSQTQQPILASGEIFESNITEENPIVGEEDDLMKSLPLTGDPEIDEEIIAFYRAKRSGGTY